MHELPELPGLPELTESPKPPEISADRRPLKSRNLKAAQTAAHFLAQKRVTANAISVAGMAFGICAGLVFIATPFIYDELDAPVTRVAWILAAILVQLRLLCNMLDGMVALESGTASPVGELYNEIPDRVADVAILAGAGYAIGGNPTAGCMAAVMAVCAAYIRAVGKTATGVNDYCGPMAKPHRMAAITGFCLVAAVIPESWWDRPLGTIDFGLLAIVLTLIALATLYTCCRRLLRITRALRKKSIESE